MANGVILKDLILELGLSVSQFEREIGVPQSRIAKMINRNTSITFETVHKILDKYPHVNKEWLLNGEGEMFEEKDISVKEAPKKEVVLLGKNPNLRLKPEDYAQAFGDWKGLPIFNKPISASFITHYREESYEPYYYLHDPRFKDCDFGAIITGDSMHSEIRHGDIVVCKEVLDKSFIVYGDIYYVVATNGLETCKYVNGHDDEDFLMLVPRNEKIKPSPIRKDQIGRLFKVRGLIRGY